MHPFGDNGIKTEMIYPVSNATDFSSPNEFMSTTPLYDEEQKYAAWNNYSSYMDYKPYLTADQPNYFQAAQHPYATYSTGFGSYMNSTAQLPPHVNEINQADTKNFNNIGNSFPIERISGMGINQKISNDSRIMQRLTPYQIMCLEGVFIVCHYPHSRLYSRLAQKLCVSPTRLRKWFAYRRRQAHRENGNDFQSNSVSPHYNCTANACLQISCICDRFYRHVRICNF